MQKKPQMHHAATVASLLTGWPSSAWIAFNGRQIEIRLRGAESSRLTWWGGKTWGMDSCDSKTNLQGWPFQDASVSSLRSQPPPGFSSPCRSAGGPAESPAPRRRQRRRPDAGMKADDAEPSPGILAWHRSSRTAPHTPRTASAARTCRWL